MKHSDICTHLDNEEDCDYLTRKLFDVNTRLFKTSKTYSKIVIDACIYMIWLADGEREGYKELHGFSGANAGIPWNIIVVNRKERADLMINPRITKSYGGKVTSMSNCGSLTLPEPIEIMRHKFIDLEYLTLEQNKRGEYELFPVTETKVDRSNGGLTIQHEVDHNLGILIFERQ